LARGYLTEGIELSQQTHDLANLRIFLKLVPLSSRPRTHHIEWQFYWEQRKPCGKPLEDKIYGYHLPDESIRALAEQQARKAIGPDAHDDALDSGRAFDVTETVLSLRQRQMCTNRRATAM
jgi:hypothetical protein